MLRYALFTAAIAHPVLAAAAAPTFADQMTACSVEASGENRLACYDGIAKQIQGSPTSSPDPTPQAANDRIGGTQAEIKNGDMFGRWRAEVTINAMTDKKTVSFGNVALPGQSDDAADAKIGLLCSGERISFVWLSSAYLGTSESTLSNVSYRVDAEKPRPEKWRTFKNVAIPDNAVSVAQAMADAKRFVFNVMGYNFESHQAVFDLDGIADVLGRLSACWPPPSPSLPAPVAETAPSVSRSTPAPARTVRQRPHG